MDLRVPISSADKPSPNGIVHLRRVAGSNQLKAATTVTAAMPVVNAKARAKTIVIFFMMYPSFGR